MSEEIAILGSVNYQARITPLKSGGRRDVEVAPNDPTLPASFEQSDIVAALRRFFSLLEEEAHHHRGDPVATSQALARMEALLADVRSVRDSIKTIAAEAIAAERIRRLTISGVCTLEGTTEIKRSGWRHAELMTQMLKANSLSLINTEDGEIISGEDAASKLLEWMNPSWKMTAIKANGLDPDAFCEVETDEEDRPMRTPTIRMVDNLVRRRDNIASRGGSE